MRALLAFSLLAAPTGAQEVTQTPEGAQRFLAQITEQHRPLFITPVGDRGDDTTGLIVGFHVEIRSSDPCVSEVVGEPAAYAFWSLKAYKWLRFDRGASGYDEAKLRKWMGETRAVRPPLTIGWARVGQVRVLDGMFGARDRPQSVVGFQFDGKEYGFELRDPATAKRVEYAMNFLKEACDKTADTGF